MKKFFIIFPFWIFALWGFMPFVSANQEEGVEDIWLDEEGDLPEDEASVSDLPPSSSQKEKKANNQAEDPPAEDSQMAGPSQAEIDMAQAEEGAEDINEESNITPTQSALNDEEENPVATPSLTDEYEQNLYETYTQYYSKKVSAEEWNNIAGNKDTYTIQDKDTLWDISKMLFNDSHYWPKLWSVNPSLGNPHLIQPQDILGFVHGTEGSPPHLTMVQKGGGADQQGFMQRPGFQALGKKKPVIQIPASLPPLYLSKRPQEKINWDIDSSPTVPQVAESFLPYYMTSEPLSAVGKVADKKDYGSWFHVGQSVLLEMREPVNPGQRLTIINDMGKLYSSTLGVRGPFGYQQQVQGEVEVVGRVPDSFDLYEARVTKSLNPLSLKAFVVGHRLIEFSHKPTDISGTGSAQIIGVPTLFEDEKKLVSPSDFVYLNRGKGSGLSVGQMYQIRANLDIPRKNPPHGYNIKVGEIKIVHAEDRFATGLVTAMQNAIHVGDYIGPLNEGLSTQKDYDPFLDDDFEEEKGGAPSASGDDDFREFEDADAVTAQKEPEEAIEPDLDDEDVFEAFE